MDKLNSFGGVKLPDALSYQNGESLIVVAEEVDLEYYDSDKSFFALELSTSSLPEEFLVSPWKYNLVVTVYDAAPNEGNILGYIANHFCYMLNDGTVMAECYDDVQSSITHHTSVTISNEGMNLEYKGFFIDGEDQNTGLATTGAKASIYLQKLI